MTKPLSLAFVLLALLATAPAAASADNGCPDYSARIFTGCGN